MKRFVLSLMFLMLLSSTSFSGVKVNPDRLYQQGVDAYDKKQYAKAIQYFESSLKNIKNKEDSLILILYERLYLSSANLKNYQKMQYYLNKYKGIYKKIGSRFKTVTIDVIRRSDQDTTTKTLVAGKDMQLPYDKGVLEIEGYLPHYIFNGHDLGETIFGTVFRENSNKFTVALPIKFPTFDKMRKGEYAFEIKSLTR